MILIRRIVNAVKMRVYTTPFTTILLIVGLVLSMLTMSICVSFISELLSAQKYKENSTPPNGTQYVLTWQGQQEFQNFCSLFEDIRDTSGVIVNGMAVHIDGMEVNTFVPISGEWFAQDDGWHYPLTEGRYYTAEEVRNSEKVVLLGKKLKPYTYTEYGETYLDIENEKYRVIGYVGIENQASLWDMRVFMPCSALPGSIIENINKSINCILYNYKGEIYIDERKISEKLFFEYTESDFIYVGEIKVQNMAEEIVNSGDMIFVLAIVGYLVSLIYAMNISTFWIEKRKKEIAVRKILGYRNKQIVMLLIEEMIGLAMISCIAALVIQLTMKLTIKTLAGYCLNIYTLNIFVGGFIVVLTAVITSMLPIYKMLKIQPIEAVKKG